MFLVLILLLVVLLLLVLVLVRMLALALVLSLFLVLALGLTLLPCGVGGGKVSLLVPGLVSWASCCSSGPAYVVAACDCCSCGCNFVSIYVVGGSVLALVVPIVAVAILCDCYCNGCPSCNLR